MEIGFLIHIVVLVFGAIVLVGVITFLVIDMFGRVDYLKAHSPWLERALERRSVLGALALVAIFLLIGDGYELLTKEIPDVPSPRIVFNSPAPPQKELTERKASTVPVQERKCWASQHFVVPNSALVTDSKAATEVDVYCNYRIEAPVQVEIEFDQNLVQGQASMAGAAYQINGPGIKGNHLSGEIAAPALPAYHLLVATVQSKQATFMTKWHIGTAP